MNNTLYHHGILGQKWGVRRFQNADGTSTTAGKARRRNNRSGKTLAQIKSEKQKENDVKKRGTFSTEQLQQKIQRLQMEKQLKDLTESELHPGRKAVKQIMTSIGTKVVTTAIAGATLYAIKAAVSKEFSPKELGNAIFNGGAKKK